MGVILKYQINFPEVGLKVSNDLTSGDFIIDADIKAQMDRGAAGSQFAVKLYDLPQKQVEKLNKKLQSTKLGTVVIKLGYLDGAFDPVMTGLYSKVVAAVEDDKLVTTISGLEIGTHALQHTRFQNTLTGPSDIGKAVTALLKEAEIKEGEIDRTPKLQPESVLSGKSLKDTTLRGENLLDILDELARLADAEFLVSDKQVRIGQPIAEDDYTPPEFSYDANLALFRPFVKNIPGEEGGNRLDKLPPSKAVGYKFIVAGDPRLRPAQKVFAPDQGYRKKDAVEFRVHSLVHSFSVSGGYVCEGVALRTCHDAACRKQQDAAGQPNAEAIIQSLSQRIKDEQRKRPVLEVGKIKDYRSGASGEAGHRSTLYFGQRYPRSETQPSVRAPVETDDQQLLRNKPLVAPFAWRKCGLVVPVYPGMKALVGHNLGLADDALVTGFIWSEEPAFEPPSNQPGDWWLCLPVDFDASSPPGDNTRAANDLTANNGKRVIEVKGLKITVGSSRLGTVGARPGEGGDDEFLIEHQSGTTLKIAADGSLSITAATISLKGDVTIEGNVDIR